MTGSPTIHILIYNYILLKSIIRYFWKDARPVAGVCLLCVWTKINMLITTRGDCSNCLGNPAQHDTLLTTFAGDTYRLLPMCNSLCAPLEQAYLLLFPTKQRVGTDEAQTRHRRDPNEARSLVRSRPISSGLVCACALPMHVCFEEAKWR